MSRKSHVEHVVSSIRFTAIYAVGQIVGLFLLAGVLIVFAWAGRSGFEPFLWIAFGVAIIGIIFGAARAHRLKLRSRRAAAGLCSDCGYDLRASKMRCPECGAEIAVSATGVRLRRKETC